MAGRQQQLVFEAAAAERQAAFRESNNELRAELRSVEPAVVGSTPYRWPHVCQLLMIVWSFQQNGSGLPSPVEMQKKTKLNRDQLKRARREAERLGLVQSQRDYDGQRRRADRLRVDREQLRRLVLASRDWRMSSAPKCSQVLPSAPKCSQPAPSVGGGSNTRARAGAAKELLINSSSSSGSVQGSGFRVQGSEEVEEEVICFLALVRKLLPAPLRLEQAVRTALAAGVTLDELRERCRWFRERQFDWPAEHRPGVLYTGLAECQSGQPANQGWPYRR